MDASQIGFVPQNSRRKRTIASNRKSKIENRKSKMWRGDDMEACVGAMLGGRSANSELGDRGMGGTGFEPVTSSV